MTVVSPALACVERSSSDQATAAGHAWFFETLLRCKWEGASEAIIIIISISSQM